MLECSCGRAVRRHAAESLVAIALCAGSAGASAADVSAGPEILKLDPPPGYCSLNEDDPTEALMLYYARQMQAGRNQLLAYWIYCSALDLFRRGESDNLSPYYLVLAQFQDGQVTRTGMSRARFLAELEKASHNGKFFTPTTEVEIRKRFDETLGAFAESVGSEFEVGDMRFLGQMDKDDIALYFGMIIGLTVDGQKNLTASVMAMTQVKQIGISINAYDDYAGQETFEVIKTRARELTYRIIAENEDLAATMPAAPLSTGDPIPLRSSSTFDWAQILDKGLVGAVGGGIIGGGVALFGALRRFFGRRPE